MNSNYNFCSIIVPPIFVVCVFKNTISDFAFFQSSNSRVVVEYLDHQKKRNIIKERVTA